MQDQFNRGYTSRKKRKRQKNNSSIFPTITIIISVYFLGVYTSDLIASIKANYEPLIKPVLIQEKDEKGEDVSISQDDHVHTYTIEEATLDELNEMSLEASVFLESVKDTPPKQSVENQKNINHSEEKETVNATVIKTETILETNNREPNCNIQPEEETPIVKPVAQKIVSHVVQPKETLYSITMKYYLDSSYKTKVASFNGITNPSTDIHVGMKLELPDPLIFAFHEVKQGETLFSITMQYYQASIYLDRLATYNSIIDPTKDVKHGLVLSIPNFSVIKEPSKPSYSILINKGENTLIVYQDNKQVKRFQVATGKSPSLTPEGTFKIVNKIEKPWYITSDIPGGDPNNPLGSHWLGLDVPGTNGSTYGIHGTNNPNSVGSYVSKGCIRMHNTDIQWLYDHIPTNTIVIIEGS
ncbi:hypothetical protein BKP45_10960 [Anaerobacillus alkalidiazotrophicus]|uniref:LysM domain-containing protein n=1 Tax=Anaerobacillus alkalidiazotrophicus TaxID=472963 RepID=A0A1S2M4D1_9BACI|nr:L,D-transpeptidase family protein [Anaerobacillus alkalidiazotrophicus]OIJ18109.1 hypothetical protein BKP45_16675 [Anaerobacillus alkalidiazotrophicus]OIJ19588.1 hypothetical protein BKP45_10960 [Anaerobacillus alkalidiazotrophicus]